MWWNHRPTSYTNFTLSICSPSNKINYVFYFLLGVGGVGGGGQLGAENASRIQPSPTMLKKVSKQIKARNKNWNDTTRKGK